MSSAASLEPVSKKQRMLNNMKSASANTAEPDTLFEDEVVRYQKHQSNKEETEQPFLCWKNHHACYPLLSRLA